MFRVLHFYKMTQFFKLVINRLRTKFFFFKSYFADLNGTAKSLIRTQLKMQEEPRAALLGDAFFGKSFFNLYIVTGFKTQNSFYFFKRFFHIYAFFLWRVNAQFDFVFFSFILNKILVHIMLHGNKATAESFFLALFHGLKMIVNLPVNLITVNAIISSRMVLNRTHIFLSGRGHMVPTPSIFDKQYKSGIRLIKMFMRKRQYVRDVLKRSLAAGRYIGRRIPLYKSISRLGALFIKTQNFFVLFAARKQNSRFLKSDVFNSLRKNIYMFILQRTYIQYRWR